MNWFRKKDDNLIKLLKDSAVDFKFEHNRVKYRLLSSIDRGVQPKSIEHRLPWMVRYGTAPILGVMILSTTFAFASASKPGDKLFPLNKLGEQVILKLPLNAEQKANIEEHIVTNRLEALDKVQVEIDSKKLETVKESDETLTSAIEKISQSKKNLEAAGKTQSVKKLEATLGRLETMAKNREATLQALEDDSSDEKIKSQIRKHRLQIRDSRNKARLEIRKYDDRQDDRNGERKSDD